MWPHSMIQAVNEAINDKLSTTVLSLNRWRTSSIPTNLKRGHSIVSQVVSALDPDCLLILMAKTIINDI